MTLPFAACDSTDYGLIVGWLVLCFVMAGAFSVVAKPPMQAIDYSADADVIEIESQSTDSRVFVRFAGLPLLRCNLSCSSTKFSKSSLRSANHDSVPRRRDADIDGARAGEPEPAAHNEQLGRPLHDAAAAHGADAAWRLVCSLVSHSGVLNFLAQGPDDPAGVLSCRVAAALSEELLRAPQVRGERHEQNRPANSDRTLHFQL